ncbi:hypothetical protein RCL1_008321 [Eukaryota sp. TZLM3-RCL]
MSSDQLRFVVSSSTPSHFDQAGNVHYPQDVSPVMKLFSRFRSYDHSNNPLLQGGLIVSKDSSQEKNSSLDLSKTVQQHLVTALQHSHGLNVLLNSLSTASLGFINVPRQPNVSRENVHFLEAMARNRRALKDSRERLMENCSIMMTSVDELRSYTLSAQKLRHQLIDLVISDRETSGALNVSVNLGSKQSFIPINSVVDHVNEFNQNLIDLLFQFGLDSSCFSSHDSKFFTLLSENFKLKLIIHDLIVFNSDELLKLNLFVNNLFLNFSVNFLLKSTDIDPFNHVVHVIENLFLLKFFNFTFTKNLESIVNTFHSLGLSLSISDLDTSPIIFEVNHPNSKNLCKITCTYPELIELNKNLNSKFFQISLFYPNYFYDCKLNSSDFSATRSIILHLLTLVLQIISVEFLKYKNLPSNFNDGVVCFSLNNQRFNFSLTFVDNLIDVFSDQPKFSRKCLNVQEFFNFINEFS